MATSALTSLLLSGMALLPTAVMHSPYRDVVLNRALTKHGLSGTSVSASGGWLTPVTFDGIRLKDAKGHVDGAIKNLRFSASLLNLIWNPQDLGTITAINPKLKLRLDDEGRLPIRPQDSSHTSKRLPNVAFELRQSEFQLSVPWRKLPIVDISRIDIAGSVATTSLGSVLTIRPIQIFDREPLSEAHTEQNLALIAPLLSQSTTLAGEVSVRIEETVIQLNETNPPPVILQGHAEFHSVSARLKKEWSDQIGGLMKRTGHDTIPNRLEIVRDSAVAFQVDSTGIRHEGLAFLLPQVASELRIESSGLVGIDEQLDLALRVQFPQVIPQTSMMKIMAGLLSQPLTLAVKGTVSKPELIMPEGASLMSDLAQRLSPDGSVSPPKDVTGSVFDVISSASSPDKTQTAEKLPGNIINLIRSIRDSKQKNASETTPSRRSNRRNRNTVPQESP